MTAQRILIVDDEELVRLVMRAVLQGAGFQVAEAADGEEALRLLRQPGQAFEVVLLDHRMPRLSGPETLRGIREQAPATKVIMLSGGIPDQDLERSISRGEVRFLQKPFANAELIQTVQDALAG
jgi:CheY-like chemotaxis protein